MKKNVLLVLLLIVALALCACGKHQAEDPNQNEPTVQTPQDNTTVDPVPNTPEPSETESETRKSITQGYAFIYNGEDAWPAGSWDLSRCVIDSLYYVDSVTEEVYLICEGPVTELSHTYAQVYGSTRIYFVTAAEPNRIYVTTPKEHTQHALVYESDLGPITNVFTGPAPFEQSALQLVIDNKQFVWLELTTGKATVVMEQYYLDYAHFSDDNPDAESWKDFNEVYFEGKLHENDPLRHYYYWIDQDKVVEITYE